jgi:hypothetical protein
VCVPYFDDDVHDVRGLAQVNAYLFGSAGERQEILEQRRVAEPSRHKPANRLGDWRFYSLIGCVSHSR